MKPFLAPFVLALGLTTPVIAEEPMPDIAHYTLANGLEVVLAPDHKVPKVVVDVHYKVGSMNEPPGRSGFAHLFEHLMFTGTEAVPDIDATHSAEGIDLNGWTWEDKTFYYSSGLSHTLPLILSVEADRMANIGAALNEDALDLERDIVLNEIRQNVLDSAGEAAYEAMRTGIFAADHPYSRSVLGSMADLAAATLDDARAFFDAYYAPGNAILVVVGDFEIAAARTLIEQTFALVPAGAPVVQPVAPDDLAPTRRRLSLEDRLPGPILLFGFAAPGQQTSEGATLPILAEILGNQEYGIFRQRLVETGIAISAGATFERGLLGGKLMFEIALPEGGDPVAAEAAFFGALDAFLAAPLDAAEVERAKLSIIVAQRVEVEALAGRGERIALDTTAFGTPQSALVDNPRILAATAEMVDRSRAIWLAPDRASVITVLPGSRGGYPPVLTESTGTPAALEIARRESVEIPLLAVGAPVAPQLPRPAFAELPNGVRVIHYAMPDAAFAHLAVSSPAGTTSDPAGQEGLIQLAIEAATFGSGENDLAAFGKALRDAGATIAARAMPRSAMMTLSVPPDAFDAGVDLLADTILRPRFDAAEWAILHADTIDTLENRDAEPGSVAALVGEWEIFPPGPGNPGPDRTVASTRAITLDAARATFARLFSPATATIYSVGPLPLADMLPVLAASFGEWPSGIEPLEGAARRLPDFPQGLVVLAVDEPGASQTALYVARPAPGFAEHTYVDALTISSLLSRDFVSRMNAVLREEHGYSYGTDGYLIGSLPEHGMIVATAPVDRDSTGLALEAMLVAFASLASEPVTAEEVARVTTGTRGWMATMAETGADLFEELLYQVGRGSTLTDEYARLDAQVSQPLVDVRQQGAALSGLDTALVVVVGDLAVVRPQLEAIGLGEIELRGIPGNAAP